MLLGSYTTDTMQFSTRENIVTLHKYRFRKLPVPLVGYTPIKYTITNITSYHLQVIPMAQCQDNVPLYTNMGDVSYQCPQ